MLETGGEREQSEQQTTLNEAMVGLMGNWKKKKGEDEGEEEEEREADVRVHLPLPPHLSTPSFLPVYTRLYLYLHSDSHTNPFTP